MESPSRLTFTIPGSLKPAAAIVEGTLAAVWLEVTGFSEFTLSFGTSGVPRRHRFLLGITELDLYRPGALLPFAALAAGSVLPFALLITVTTLLPAILILWLVRLLVEPFPGLERYVQIPSIRLAIILLATLAIQLAAAGLIPGRPAPWLLAIPLAAAAPPVLLMLTRRAESATLTLGLTAVGLVFLQCVIALFPWGAGQLTQF